jgi:hypothetical protein
MKYSTNTRPNLIQGFKRCESPAASLKAKKVDFLQAVFRIRDLYPGSEFFLPGTEFFPSRISDPNFFHPGSRIRIKEFKYFNPKKKISEICFGKFISDPDPDFFTGSGSAKHCPSVQDP